MRPGSVQTFQTKAILTLEPRDTTRLIHEFKFLKWGHNAIPVRSSNEPCHAYSLFSR
jgi:hypothetical protein